MGDLQDKFKDISEKSYKEKTFPVMYAQCDFTIGSKLYVKNDEFDTYHFNYSRLVELMQKNMINIRTVIIMKNAPLI